MLKTRTIELPGRDSGVTVTLTELPALIADRFARDALKSLGEDPDGGVVALALRHAAAVYKLGNRANALLQPFVRASTTPSDWRNVLTLQQLALTLHAGFVVDREAVEIPVTLQAAQLRGGSGPSVSFCSPPLAAVLHSDRASYRELETVLSTEDVYNLVDLINVQRITEWRAHQAHGAKT